MKQVFKYHLKEVTAFPDMLFQFNMSRTEQKVQHSPIYLLSLENEKKKY